MESYKSIGNFEMNLKEVYKYEMRNIHILNFRNLLFDILIVKLYRHEVNKYIIDIIHISTADS